MDAQERQSMACPLCHTGLVMSERQGIEIDYCPRCRGVWLDRGELDKIVERSAVHAGREAPPRPAPASLWPAEAQGDRQGWGGRKKRKSFLEELFD
jgi:Zn-finger nucleic acid-binding protein